MGADDTPRFPASGTAADELLAAIRGGRGDDADWRAGRTFSLVYNPVDPELERLQEAVAHEYLHENYLNPFAFPSLLRMERDVVAMGADLFRGNPRGGKLTSGGTESLFLAVQVARDHARTVRGIAEPTIVVPATAHPAFAKACHYLDVAEIRVPVGADGRADLAATAAAVDDRTALVVGSAPCYPYGVGRPDPRAGGAGGGAGRAVPRRRLPGRLAAPVPRAAGRAGAAVGLPGRGRHVAVGRHPQVRLVLQGRVAAAAPRRRDLLPLQYFLFDGWPGGLYGSATTAGTRPAAPIAAAWATIKHLGEDGYLRLADEVRAASAALRAGIEAIDGLHVTGDPVPGVMEVAADEGGRPGGGGRRDGRPGLAPRPPAGRAPRHRVAVAPRCGSPTSSPTWPTPWPPTARAGASTARYGGIG